MAILLVVLFHAGGLVPTDTTGGAAWAQLNAILASVRMPLFFLVSGLFVGKALANLSFGRFFRKKAWPPLYLWLLWGLISIGFYYSTAGNFGASAYDIVAMQATLWYMVGLTVHMVVAFALRKVPKAVQFTLTGLLSLPFAIFFPFELAGLGHIPRYVVFFLAGCYLRNGIVAMVRDARIGRVLLLFGICGTLMATALGLRVLDIGPQWWQAIFLFALMPVAAVPLTLILCRYLADTRLGQFLAWQGKHTLPIFLIHPFALEVLGFLGAERLSYISVAAFGMPLALTVAAMLMSVFLWHWLEMYFPWLFAPSLHHAGRHHNRKARRARSSDAGESSEGEAYRGAEHGGDDGYDRGRDRIDDRGSDRDRDRGYDEVESRWPAEDVESTSQIMRRDMFGNFTPDPWTPLPQHRPAQPVADASFGPDADPTTALPVVRPAADRSGAFRSGASQHGPVEDGAEPTTALPVVRPAAGAQQGFDGSGHGAGAGGMQGGPGALPVGADVPTPHLGLPLQSPPAAGSPADEDGTPYLGLPVTPPVPGGVPAPRSLHPVPAPRAPLQPTDSDYFEDLAPWEPTPLGATSPMRPVVRAAS